MMKHHWAGMIKVSPPSNPASALWERFPTGLDFDSVAWEVLPCPLPSVAISEMDVGKCELHATL